ncbi:MAG: hypothetical protein WD077_05255 [Bacteroidia bacterium]
MRRIFNVFKAALLCAFFSFTACDDDVAEPTDETAAAIEISCDYFSENENAVLVDNANAPIDYIIDCLVSIGDDVKIEPGVTIAFEQGAGFKVMSDGSLNAVGTTENPITLTATDEQKGWWRGIEFFSTNNRNKISHAIIEYAVSGGSTINGEAAIAISNSASLELIHTTIQNSSENGLFIETRGISGSDEDRIEAITLQGNTYTENKFPVSIPFYMIGNLDANDDYSGNEQDNVIIHSSQMSGVSISMHALNVPYQSTGNLHLSSDDNATHLTIEAGAELEMAAGSNFIVFGGTNYLTATGTATEPIIIRGADQSPGSWENLRYRRSGPANHNILEHVQISHARSDVNNHSGALNLDFVTNTLKLVLNEVHFSEIAGTNCPIEYSGDLSGLTHSNLSDDEGELPGCL